MSGLERNGLQPFAPETLAPDVKDRGIVKDAVQSAQERVVFIEVLPPERRALVAGKDQIESALLVVAAVNQIKEQTRVLFVKLAMPNLVNNQTGRTREVRVLASLPSLRALVNLSRSSDALMK